MVALQTRPHSLSLSLCGSNMYSLSTFSLMVKSCWIFMVVAFPQDVYDQEEAGKEDAAEQANPSLDSCEDR